MIKGREKVRVDVPGLPPLSAYVPSRPENGVWQLTTPRREDIPESSSSARWRQANRTGITIRGWTTPHYKDVPWLKAAYLAVFSLLGVYGHRVRGRSCHGRNTKTDHGTGAQDYFGPQGRHIFMAGAGGRRSER